MIATQPSTEQRPVASAAARRAIGTIPTAPRSAVIAGTFKELDGALAVMRALRRAGATEDIIGFATPLPGDPTNPDTLETLIPPRRRRFDPVGLAMVIIDPHKPPPDYRTLIRGQNSVLARPLLGKLWGWLIGVQEFRVPDPNSPDGGVWVLGRPNHAAAVGGARGAALGGSAGALASLGLPESLIPEYLGRLFDGQTILTLCETDEGRVQRDYKLMGKHGALRRDITPALHGSDVRQP
jgi:hypothetical protein